MRSRVVSFALILSGTVQGVRLEASPHSNFPDGKIHVFTLVTQICHLAHKQGLVI